MLVVIDTNIIFQGLDSDKGASFKILELLYQQKISLALSYPVICEYEEVLSRPHVSERLKLSLRDIKDFLAYIAYIAFPFDPDFIMRPNLKDEKDNIFAELAFVSNADFLITNNIKDYTINSELNLDNFEIITPKDFIHHWRKSYEN